MVVIGGSGSIWGAVFGTAFLIMINYILELLQGISEKIGLKITLMDFNIVIYGTIFLLALLFMPEGFTGLKEKIFSGLKRKKADINKAREYRS
jgi:branched-chain amino acid transport system permease protein